MSGKWCPDCSAMRPVSEFGGNVLNKGGLSTYCRKHARIRGQASYAKRTGNARGESGRYTFNELEQAISRWKWSGHADA